MRSAISGVFDKLQQKFQLTAKQPAIANAPGTSGCFGAVVLVLLVGAAVVVNAL
jgi:hypothetical protein